MKNEKPVLPENLVPDAFVNRFGPLLKYALGGFDRLRFHASLRPLYSPGWMYGYLCAAKILLKDFADHAKALSLRVCLAGQESAKQAGRPYHYLRSSKINKEQFIEEIAQRDKIRQGLIAVLGAVEPCVAVTVRGDRETKRLVPVVETRKCLHLYHYWEHPQLGRCHLRLQTWYPFSVDVCANGRLWLARQMAAEGLGYKRADNCFIHLADPVRAQELADAQWKTDWLNLLNPLLVSAHGLREEILRPLKLEYYWTVSQSEYATDLLFKDGKDLPPIFQAFVQHGLCTFQSPDVMRFLGHQVPVKTGRVNGRLKDEVQSDVKLRYEGCRIKHRVGLNSIKGYDKYWGLYRVETTLVCPEFFKIYRSSPPPELKPLVQLPPTPRAKTPNPPQRMPAKPSPPSTGQKRSWQRLRRTVADMPRRAEVSRAANKRYLDALASTQISDPLGPAAATICRPVIRQGKRYRALNPFSAGDALCLKALCRGEWAINGFHNRDLRAEIYPTRPQDKAKARRQSAAVGRKLRLLRAHGLIAKVGGTHRYQVTSQGRALLTALAAAHQADTKRLTAAFAA
jgi:hypothetical protein